MLGGVGDALNAASSMLGGPPGGGAPIPGSDKEPKFANAEDLGMTEAQAGGALGKNQTNVADRPEKIEFIHFGWVYLDDSDHFPHASLTDDKPPEKPLEGPTARGIMYRDALEREALLISMFMNACQDALEDYEASKGGAGAIVGMAADLIGGGGGSQGPKAADLNSLIEKVKTAVTPLNAATIEYKKTHKAGIDLHDAFTKYRAYADHLIKTPPGSEKKGGALGGLSNVASALSSVTAMLPGVGEILTLIQGIAFKAFDVYLALYLRIAEQQEPRICEAARKMTVEAIKKNNPLIFPVWFPPPDAPPASALPNDPSTGVDFIDDTGKSALDTARDVEKGVRDVKDFFNGAGKEAPGTPFLDMAFGSAPLPRPESPVAEAAKPQKKLADLIIAAFKKAMDMKSLPGFVEDIISEIIAMDAEFLRAMYQKLAERDNTQPVKEAELYEAARKRLLQKLVNLLLNLVSLQGLKNAGMDIMGVDIRAGKLLDKGQDELNREFLAALDPALAFVMKKVAANIEGARQLAAKEKCLTMEAYLGIFPGLLALLFRDTFFPVWDLLVDNTFGQLDGLKDVVKAARGAMKDMRDSVDKARDYQKKAQNVSDLLSNPGALTVGSDSNLDEQKKKWEDAVGDTASRDPEQPQAVAKFVFPITGRLNTGKGKEIDAAEFDSIHPPAGSPAGSGKAKWDSQNAPQGAGGAPAGAPAGGPALPAAPPMPSAPSVPGF